MSFLKKFHSEWGWIVIAGNNSAVTNISLPTKSQKEASAIENNFLLLQNSSFNLNTKNKLLLKTINQLKEYFSGTRDKFNLPIDVSHGTKFQQKVWNLVHQIPYGDTLSYGQIAAQIGHSGAARAVGTAMGANPIPLIIPCHRVVTSNNKLGGFGGGENMKRKLLKLEGINF